MKRFSCWQVSVYEDDGRKYHHFTHLGSALYFVERWVKKYIKDTGYMPQTSANVSYRVFPMGAKPSRLDGKPFKGGIE